MSHPFKTPDELAGALYAQQGYLVVAGLRPCTVGEIVPCKSGETIHNAREIATRLRVIGPSNYREWHDQCVLSHSLLGYVEQIDRYPYYHRTEAVD